MKILLQRKIIILLTTLLLTLFFATDFFQDITFQDLFKKPHLILKKTNPCEKIVSLAPSITEILFALDLSEQIVGLTRFCKHPPEALTKRTIGGYIKPHYEALLEIKPSLVFLLEEHELEKKKLSKLKLNWIMLKKRNIKDILNSIKLVGEVCKVKKKALQLVNDLKLRIKKVKEKTKNQRKPRVLISLGRKMGEKSVKDTFIAGKETFYDDILYLAGGANAFQKKIFATLFLQEKVS